jgi:hypothetical protein
VPEAAEESLAGKDASTSSPARRRLLGALLASIGLALFLWPAISAPIVRWSDSETDLSWARRGIGIFSAVPLAEQLAAGNHVTKPLYLAFLRVAIAVAPEGQEARTVVILQSLLVFAAMLWVSYSAHRTGPVLFVLLLLLLRLRDTTSAIMPEALSAAMLIAIAGGVLIAPATWSGAGALGVGVGILFWVRPNAGAIALVLLAARYLADRRVVAALRVLVGFLLIFITMVLATRTKSPSPPSTGLAFSLFTGSVDYCWDPAIHEPPATDFESQRKEELRQARERWRYLVRSSLRGQPDAARQIVWRCFHGIFGTEYYDGRWSPTYWRLTTFSRIFTPFLLLASISLFLTFPFRGRERSVNIVAVLLVALLVAQDLTLGSLPRFGLPFLPMLLIFAVPAAAGIRGNGKRIGLAVAFLLILAGLTFRSRQILDWEWGRVDRAGATIRQNIPRGALPPNEPTTLHIRIAPPVLPSNANLVVRVGSSQIFSTERTANRDRPDIAIPLPQWLLDQNARGPIELELTSVGDYSPTSYLLFPVIPPPWSAAARRADSPMLSEDTGIAQGSLDWWAHAGNR